MSDYESMYFELFNAVTKAIELLQNAQQNAENIYVSSAQKPISVIKNPPKPQRKPPQDEPKG